MIETYEINIFHTKNTWSKSVRWNIVFDSLLKFTKLLSSSGFPSQTSWVCGVKKLTRQ